MRPKSVDRIKPGPGQESVWDYPRPPRLESLNKSARVMFGGLVIADSAHALRCLETSHPPTIYIPRSDINTDYLQPSPGRSICEFKGPARYWSVVVKGRVAERAAWEYPEPWPGFEALKDHLCFYASLMDECQIDGETVRSQESDFYGGWITKDIVGPFKGPSGTLGW